MGGSLKLDPRPMTLRQLVWMNEGSERHVWSVASVLLAMMANCHGDGETDYEPDDFNPTLTKLERRRNAIEITDENIEEIRREFKLAFGD